MAHMQIAGPYRVRRNEDGMWEIIEIVGKKSVSLRPRLIYAQEKRTSAYRRLALMNRKWQRTSSPP
jgi:hypothetical protein